MENKDTQTVNFTIDNTKKSIVIDALLDQYGNSLIENLVELDNIQELTDENAMCVCKFKFNCIMGHYQMFELIWGHQYAGKFLSKEQLKGITYINNLDSVLDYDKFNLPLMFLFPLLECIRLNQLVETMYIIGYPPSAEIYVSLKPFP